MARKKTPEYTRKAIARYNAKFDRIMVSLPAGSKELIRKQTGKSCNAFFVDLFQKWLAENGLTIEAESETEKAN